MISFLKFNELENCVDLLVNCVLELEQQVCIFIESQGGDIFFGMVLVVMLVVEFGILMKKVEELVKNMGVMLVRMKVGGFIVLDNKFREVVRQVLCSVKCKYGLVYWYYLLFGKFQMSGGIL